MNILAMFLGVSALSATLRLMVPVLFSAIGGCFGHKASVLNIGLESFLAISAFFAMVGSYLAENAWLRLLFGVLAGVAASVIFAVFVFYFNSNPMVTGIAMNLTAWGITNFLLGVMFNARGVFIDPRIKSFMGINIPLVKDIPFVGEVISGHNLLVYLAFAAVLASYMLMYKTSFGLRLRGVGIKQVAAQSVTERISAGNGFLALAAIMVGGGNPAKTLLACLVFGYVSALSVSLQSIGLPSQVVLSFPYIITVVILVVNAVLNKIRKRHVQANMDF